MFLLLVSAFALVLNCVFMYFRAYLEHTGSSRDVLQNGSLVAVLKEDGPIVVDIQHFYVDGSCACFSVPSWAVIYKKYQQTVKNLANGTAGRLWVLIPGLPDSQYWTNDEDKQLVV